MLVGMTLVYTGCTSSASRMEMISESLNFSDRKVMYRMNYLIMTEQPESLHVRLVDIANQYEGYMVEQSNNITTIRVPAKAQSEVGSIIEGMGYVAAKEIFGKDVTEEYEDLNIKLETLEKARNRYLELLSRAETVDAALDVERELERVNRDIDLLKGKLNSMTHLIEYATIQVTTKKPVKPGPLGWIFYGLIKASSGFLLRVNVSKP